MPNAPSKYSHSLGDLTTSSLTDTVSDLKVISCDFQRDIARMKAQAAAGHTVPIVSAGEELVTVLVHGLRLISNDTRIRQWGGASTLWRTARR